MIDIKYQEKINAIKEKYEDGDEEAKRQIAEWENQIRKLSIISDFKEQEPVKYMQNVLKKRIKDILMKRATGKGHTPESLNLLEAREEELRYCLSLFSPNYEMELGSLEQLLDNELI